MAAAKDLPRVQAPSDAPPIVILPGFGNCSSDYIAPFGLKEEGIAHFLQVTDSSQTVNITPCLALPSTS